MKKLRINFFEEFYTRDTLKKRCVELQFPSTVYVACASFDLFLDLHKEIKLIAPHVNLGFWPVLEKSYWISAFSYEEELKKLLKFLSEYSDKESLDILLDFELPLRHPKLLFTNILNLRKNKQIIEDILCLSSKQNLNFLAAEYPMPFSFFRLLGKFLGVHYSHSRFQYTTITMQYNTNVGRITKKFFMNKTISEVKKNSNYQIALGLIASGIFNEKRFLSPEVLRHDLVKLAEEKVAAVTIYSLAGYKGEYKKVINEFASQTFG